jgi:hypothetical protein
MGANIKNRFDKILAKADALGAKISKDAQWYLQNWILDNPRVQLDDDQSFVLSRALEAELAIRPEAPRPELPLAEGDLLPTIMVDRGAKTYHYPLHDAQGQAEWSSGSGADMPMVSVSSAEMIGHLAITHLGYSWDTEDLRNAQFAGQPLQPQLANAATRGHMEEWDTALAWGRESQRLLGLFNHPNITLLASPGNGAGGSTFWRDKDIAQMLADIASLINVVPQVMNETRHINTILWSPRLGRYLRQTLAYPLEAGNSDTLWNVIRRTFVGDADNPVDNPVEFREVRYCDATNARSQGRVTSDFMFGMIRGDQTKVAKVNCFDPAYAAPQQTGFTINVYGEAKRGAIEMAEPLTCVRMDGIFNG